MVTWLAVNTGLPKSPSNPSIISAVFRTVQGCDKPIAIDSHQNTMISQGQTAPAHL